MVVLHVYAAAANAKDVGVSADEFFQAIDQGNVSTVESYILSDKDIRVRSKQGYSALAFLFRNHPYKSSKASQERIAELLIDAGASVNETVPIEVNPSNVPIFVWAVHTDSETIVNLFIQRGVDKKARVEGLFTAVSRDRINICRRILVSGIDINSRDEFGQTPLFLVSSISMAKYLISNGADVNAKNSDGESVLGWLSRPINETDKRIVSYLVSKGAK